MKTKRYPIIMLAVLTALMLVSCSFSQVLAMQPEDTDVQNTSELTVADEQEDVSVLEIGSESNLPLLTQDLSDDESEDDVSRPEGWDEETHGKSADPNYAVVFPDDEVNRIDITIDPAGSVNPDQQSTRFRKRYCQGNRSGPARGKARYCADDGDRRLRRSV